jgi:hypothetical protein
MFMLNEAIKLDEELQHYVKIFGTDSLCLSIPKKFT